MVGVRRLPKPWWLPLAIALITLGGAVLRVAAARGDLWLDEIWSFRLLDDGPSAARIVFGLAHDNNHVLTTLWLAFVGPSASPLLVRLPAILFGALSIPLAARIGARRGPATAVASATVVAFAYAFVHFGSEARGYAGLILAVLVALDALEARAAGEAKARSLIVFGGAIAFGTFSHLTMVEATAVLCATAVLQRSPDAPARPILLAAIAGTLPAALCFGVSMLSGSFHRGLITPFSLADFGIGLGRLVRATIGLPDGPLDPLRAGLLLVGMAGCVVAGLVVLPRDRRPFFAMAILSLPALHVAFQIPNQQYPRFHLTAAIALALLGAAVWGEGWRRGRPARAVAILAALAFLGGQGLTLASFLRDQRGHYADAVALMGANGSATFTVLPPVQAGETAATIRWYAARSGTAFTPAGGGDACPRADWLVTVRLPYETGKAAPSESEDACHTVYRRATTEPAYGLSGFTWILSRRRD